MINFISADCAQAADIISNYADPLPHLGVPVALVGRGATAGPTKLVRDPA